MNPDIEENVIVLNWLFSVTNTDETGRPKDVVLRKPTPCGQKNAKGRLKGYETFEDFCEDAKEKGKAFKAALK